MLQQSPQDTQHMIAATALVSHPVSTSEDDLLARMRMHLPHDTQIWTRLDKRANHLPHHIDSKTTAGTRWDYGSRSMKSTGHTTSLDWSTTKHTIGKDVHECLPKLVDIQTILRHRSLVIPTQQLKQSFHYFAPYGTHQSPQSKPDDICGTSEGSVRSGGLIGHELRNSHVFCSREF